MTNRILIAGIGSGSLGMELLKCISLSDQYKIYGVDISQSAYGHNDNRFSGTKAISAKNTDDYLKQVLQYAQDVKANIIAPGAEATHKIISENRDLFTDRDLTLMINSKEVINLCSDKVKCNDFLTQKGYTTAKTILALSAHDLKNFCSFPCVIKPAQNSGGSNMVFVAENIDEAVFFVNYIGKRGFNSCVQEYIESEDEFTVGVLSSKGEQILSSIALKRNLESKLSRSMSYGNRVISSGWSQGRIDYYSDVCHQAEQIAKTIGSTWALNVQGRLRNGVLIPFEINPRHSGTSYLRALAGINEPLLALASLSQNNLEKSEIKLKVGQYLRVLNEYFMPEVVP